MSETFPATSSLYSPVGERKINQGLCHWRRAPSTQTFIPTVPLAEVKVQQFCAGCGLSSWLAGGCLLPCPHVGQRPLSLSSSSCAATNPVTGTRRMTSSTQTPSRRESGLQHLNLGCEGDTVQSIAISDRVTGIVLLVRGSGEERTVLTWGAGP